MKIIENNLNQSKNFNYSAAVLDLRSILTVNVDLCSVVKLITNKHNV